MKIYLDNCCFNRPYDDQGQLRIELETKAKLYVQFLIVTGKLDLVVSFVSEDENNTNPFIERKTSIAGFFDFAKVLVEPTQGARDIAKSLETTGIKSKDATHLACAIVGGCDFFLSTDDRLLKARDERISIMNPIDFVLLWEENKNE
jgi:hypothetical protein